MQAVLAFVIVVLTTIAMEGAAWAAHRYLMHGWGWRWHRSHHEPHEGVFELNDLYAVVFGLLAVVFFVVASAVWPPLFWIAVGMTIYGVAYFFVHDGLVHQRWPFRHRPRNAYLKRLVQAHRMHHAVEGRGGCVSFGFLYAPPIRALRESLRQKHPNTLRQDAAE